MEITLVRANIQDAENLWKMQIAAFQDLYAKYQDPETSPATETLEKTMTRLEQPYTYYYYIKVEDCIVGAMRVIDHKEDGKYKFLSPIFIMKEFRGRGYAQQAMRLDLVKLLVKHKASTFFFRIDGVSMVDTGMDEGDIIIVDRAIDPYNNCKAVCFIDGEYTVKRVEIHEKGVRLMPANENNTAYKPIDVTAENNFVIWGIVTYVIKKM